jgi:hypothetical protein
MTSAITEECTSIDIHALDYPRFIQFDIMALEENRRCSDFTNRSLHLKQIPFRTRSSPTKKEMNLQLFKRLIETFSDENIQKLGNISKLIDEYCKGYYCHDPLEFAFYACRSKASYEFRVISDNIGQIVVSSNELMIGEFGDDNSQVIVNATINGVIHYKHCYYALTKDMFTYLSESKDPRIVSVMTKLFY